MISINNQFYDKQQNLEDLDILINIKLIKTYFLFQKVMDENQQMDFIKL